MSAGLSPAGLRRLHDRLGARTESGEAAYGALAN
jgi:hypothetical protein